METFSIAERLDEVRQRIAVAARACGRCVEGITLVAVSKTRSSQEIREAYEAGQRDFGENYVQELVRKAEELADLEDLRWHMIGQVQTNKVKRLVEVARVVQTVDRLSLACELGKRIEPGKLDVFVEVNVGQEESKAGVSEGEAEQLVAAVSNQSGLRLRGLMTVPPFDLELDKVAVYFEKLRRLGKGFGLMELSMGMSHDFELAIAHGSTMVRVGTAIFGERS